MNLTKDDFEWRDVRLLVDGQEVLVSSTFVPSMLGKQMSWCDLFIWLNGFKSVEII